MVDKHHKNYVDYLYYFCFNQDLDEKPCIAAKIEAVKYLYAVLSANIGTMTSPTFNQTVESQGLFCRHFKSIVFPWLDVMIGM